MKMTDAELDEALAVEVMGSRKGRINPHPSNPVFWLDDSKPNRESLSYYSWRPTADLNQAFEALDEGVGYWTMFRFGRSTPEVSVSLSDDDTTKIHSTSSKSLPRAICEAVLMAVRAE